jgi:P pilus assembly chaperone PapD
MNMMSSKLTLPMSERFSRQGFFIVAIVLCLLCAGQVLAGILVAPTVVVLTDKNRTARLDINNPGSTPQEVTVGFAWGLPESDSVGNVRVILQDSNITDTKSAIEWIKAFPRQMVIPPNGTQVIRFVATPPKGLADGEYWGRVVVRSKEGQKEIPTATTDGGITTKLNMIMQTAIMIKYRTGSLSSEVEVTGTTAQKTDSTVCVTIDLASKGNVSYVGVMTCRLLDASKKEISRAQTDLAVYRELRRRVELPLKGSTGHCTVEVSVTTDGRTDIAPEDVIPGNKVFSSVEVQ